MEIPAGEYDTSTTSSGSGTSNAVAGKETYCA